MKMLPTHGGAPGQEGEIIYFGLGKSSASWWLWSMISHYTRIVWSVWECKVLDYIIYSGEVCPR